MSSHLDYVLDYAPTLAPIAARLLDGADGRIYVSSAGPQPGTKFYDPSEPPYFFVQVVTGEQSAQDAIIRVTAEGVEVVFGVWEDGEFYADEPQHMTHESLRAYVGQLPRPLNYYVEGGNS